MRRHDEPLPREPHTAARGRGLPGGRLLGALAAAVLSVSAGTVELAAEDREPERTMLWALEREGGATSWLLGTDVAARGDAALPAGLREVLEQVDVVHFDGLAHALVEASAWSGAGAVLPDPVAAPGLARPDVGAVRPPEADAGLAGLLALAGAAGPGPEQRLVRAVRRAGTPVVPLWHGRPKVAPDPDEDARLGAAVRARIAETGELGEPGEGRDERGAGRLPAGDPRRALARLLAVLPRDPELAARALERFVSEPNRRLAERIVELVEGEPGRAFLFAVGAEHLPGEDGVLELLEARGLRPRRVDAGPAEAARPLPARGTRPAFEPADWGRI